MVNNKSFCFVVAGGCLVDLKQECSGKGIKLAAHYSTFLDLRQHFSKGFGVDMPSSTECMVKKLELAAQDDIGTSTALNECYTMASIATRLCDNGYVFNVIDSLPPVAREEQEAAPPLEEAKAAGGGGTGSLDDIVRLRGLPWESTEDDIMDFFSGQLTAPIAKSDIVVVLKHSGRPSGEAFVQLGSQADHALALTL
jgi:hypothetical protein